VSGCQIKPDLSPLKEKANKFKKEIFKRIPSKELKKPDRAPKDKVTIIKYLMSFGVGTGFAEYLLYIIESCPLKTDHYFKCCFNK